MRYRRIEILSTSEDRTVAELFEAGCLGIEHQVDSMPGDPGLARLIVYFPASVDTPSTDKLAAWGARVIDEQLLEERDWLENYRLVVEPIPVGQHFILDASEPDVGVPKARPEEDEDPGSRHLLRLPARQAFGTGSHETTQLMIEGLERLDLSRRRVLDVGVGTGVLSFVAQILGASSVLAYDLDPKAPVATIENARLNGLARPSLFVGTAEALAARPRFDLLLVNVLEDRIEADIPRLCSGLDAGGRALVSGVLVERRQQALTSWRQQGLRLQDSWQRGEWLLLSMIKPLSSAEERQRPEGFDA